MAIGLYQHISRAAGTIVTSTLYNTAHLNHLTNDIPTSVGPHSSEVQASIDNGATALTTFRAITDPAPAGTATPVIDLGHELEQLRFVIKDIKTALNFGVAPTWWYTPITVAATQVQAHGARVFRNTTQSIGNGSSTAVIFNTVRYDTGVVSPAVDPFWNAITPTRLTASVTGLYQISGWVPWNSGPTTGNLQVFIRRNDGKLLSESRLSIPGTSALRTMPIGSQFLLNATEYVELFVFQLTGGALNTINPEFGIELLNPSQAIPPPPPAPGFFVIQNNAPFVVNNTTVPFVALTNPQPATAQNVAGRMQVRMPADCTITNMHVTLSAVFGGIGDQIVFQFVVNGVASTDIETALSSGDLQGQGSGSLVLATDDLVYIQTTYTGATVTANVQNITIGYTVAP
jgi:hypothetical protein